MTPPSERLLVYPFRRLKFKRNEVLKSIPALQEVPKCNLKYGMYRPAEPSRHTLTLAQGLGCFGRNVRAQLAHSISCEQHLHLSLAIKRIPVNPDIIFLVARRELKAPMFC